MNKERDGRDPEVQSILTLGFPFLNSNLENQHRRVIPPNTQKAIINPFDLTALHKRGFLCREDNCG